MEELRRKQRIIAALMRQLAAETAEENPRREEPQGRQIGEVADGVQVEPRNPLALLPREMWAAIFDRLNDGKELQSCSDTCQLFRSLLEDSKNEWLFTQVYPILKRYLNYGDALKCRKVCKAWLKEVEKSIWVPTSMFYLPFSGPEDPQRVHLEEINSPESTSRLRCNRICMGVGVRNPGINANVAQPFLLPARLDQAKQVLRDMGVYIKHLELEFDTSVVGTRGLWEVVLFALSTCRNLISLMVRGRSGFQEDLLQHLTEDQIRILTPEDFTIPSSLESVRILSLQQSRQLEEFIFQRCSTQLKFLCIDNWSYQTELFAGLEWNSLKEINVWGGDRGGPHYFQRLALINAPELESLAELSASLNSLSGLFPKLSTISLCSLTEFNDIATVPDGLMAATSIKTLVLTAALFPNDTLFRYSFLMYFLSVETLKLHTFVHPTENDLPLDQDFLEVTPAWMQKKYVYWSNVWEILPRLQKIVLKVMGPSSFEIVCYTREEYDAFQADLHPE